MLVMPLTKGKETLIDDCDADLAVYKWGYVLAGDHKPGRSRHHESGYAVRGTTAGGVHRTFPLHKTIMERKLGHPIPEGFIVDHRNNDRLDNRRENLRLATYAQNMQNSVRSGKSTSKYKGVTFKQNRQRNGRGKWVARIIYQGKRILLGRFSTPEEAALAYNMAALEYFGEFARLNDIAS